MDIDDLKQIHIQPEYHIGFDINDPHVRGIFAFRPAAVLYAAVGSTHKRSSEFAADVRRVLKKWRKKPCTDAAELATLLFTTCKDKALKCPWRPDEVKPLRIITSHVESEQSWNERRTATGMEWTRLMQELCEAMNGTRPCKIVIMKPENN